MIRLTSIPCGRDSDAGENGSLHVDVKKHVLQRVCRAQPFCGIEVEELFNQATEPQLLDVDCGDDCLRDALERSTTQI